MKFLVKKIAILLVSIILATSLSGCIAAALLGGAAGGAYLGKNYEIVKKDNQSPQDNEEADE